MIKIAKLLAISMIIVLLIATVSALFAMSRPVQRDWTVLFAEKGINVSLKKPIYCKVTKEDFLKAKDLGTELALK